MGDPNHESITSDKPPLRGGANISVDVDSVACYREIHGLSPRSTDGDPIWRIGVERARELFDEFDIKATFFIVGRDLESQQESDQARELAETGHELANHTYDHRYDLTDLSQIDISHQVRATDRIIAEVTGEQPVGFRAPGYNISSNVLTISRRAGHRYDASVFPCVTYWTAKAAVMGWRALRGDPSRSERTDPKALLAPRHPYFPDPVEYWKRAAQPGPYVEIPVAAFAGRSLPIIGTTLHLLDAIGLVRIWPIIDRSFPGFFNLEMHAIDFVDGNDLDGLEDRDQLVSRQPDLRIEWPKKKERYRRFFSELCDRRQVVTLAEATAEIGST